MYAGAIYDNIVADNTAIDNAIQNYIQTQDIQTDIENEYIF